MIRFDKVLVRRTGDGSFTKEGKHVMKLAGECMADGGVVNLTFVFNQVHIRSHEYVSGTLEWRTKSAKAKRRRRSNRRKNNRH